MSGFTKVDQDELRAKLEIENLYNRYDPFKIAFGLLVFASFCFFVRALLAENASARGSYQLSGFSAASLAIVCMLIGTLVRVWIMGRAPVGTLYESVLFVSLVLSVGLIFISNTQASGLERRLSDLA